MREEKQAQTDFTSSVGYGMPHFATNHRDDTEQSVWSQDQSLI